MSGKVRVRFDVQIEHADGSGQVVRGHTIHAVTDAGGKPIRPPAWFVQALQSARSDE